MTKPIVHNPSPDETRMSEPTCASCAPNSIPHAYPDLVERPRLTARLSEGVRCKLTIISAPAGSGKTTLIANWQLRVSNVPLAWVSLDECDNDPSRFWAYLVAALQTLQPDAGQTVLACFNHLSRPPLKPFSPSC